MNLMKDDPTNLFFRKIRGETNGLFYIKQR